MVKPEQCSGFFFESGEDLGKSFGYSVRRFRFDGVAFFIALIEF